MRREEIDGDRETWFGARALGYTQPLLVRVLCTEILRRCDVHLEFMTVAELVTVG